MTEKLTLELVSPERLLASLEADMVVAPGEEGEFGVLVDHAPFMTTLGPGVIHVYEGDRVARQFFVEGGFVEVNEKSCIVLADDAAPLAEIDKEAAEKALRAAKKALEALPADAHAGERIRAERAERAAEVRIEALNAA